LHGYFAIEMNRILVLLAFYAILGESFTITPNINIGPNKFIFGMSANSSAGQYDAAYNVDNDTDVADLLQQALDDIYAAGGGVLLIQRGTYVLNHNIQINYYTHLQGECQSNTILQLGYNVTKFALAGFIHNSFISDFIISNITLDGNKYNQLGDDDSQYGQYGIFNAACVRVWYDHVTVQNFMHYGFDPHGDKGLPTYGEDLYITNCLSQENNWDGFTLDMSIMIVAYNNTAIHNGRHGFNIVTGSKNVTLIDNTALNNGYYYPGGGGGGCGVMVQNNQNYSTENVVVFNSTLIGNNRGGICLDGVPNILLDSNVIENTCTCFYLTSVSSTVIQNNFCAGKTLYVSQNTTIDNSGVLFVDNVFEYQSNCLIPVTASGGNYYIVGYNLTNSSSVFNVPWKGGARAIIQLALDTVVANGGGTVHINQGLYSIDGVLIVGSGITLEGSGMNITTLKLTDYATAFTVGFDGFIRSRMASNVTIANLTLDGNSQNQYTDSAHIYGRSGLFSEACTNYKAYMVLTMNFQQSGMNLHGWDNTNIWGQNVYVDRCIATNNLWHGIQINQVHNISVTNSVLSNNGENGIQVNKTQYFNAAYNVANSNGFASSGCGYLISDNLDISANLNQLMNNNASGNAKGGVCLNTVKIVNVVNNNILYSCTCFNIALSPNIMIDKNKCTGNKLVTTDGSYTLPTDNTFTKIPMTC